jgi:4-carboxymuconolactone decarboxylase
MTDQESRDRQRQAGFRVRRDVLGDDHVNRSIARTTEFDAAFQDLLTRFVWGEVWTRPGLDRKTRSAITIATLVALRAEDELVLHIRAGLRNGLTPAEISEVLLHVAIYAGIPAANTAFGIARQMLEEEGLLGPAGTDGEVPGVSG